MLRVSPKSRSRSKKSKYSKNLEKNIQEKSKYEEDYNEIILNDLVPEEHREEFGLDNEDNKKKQGGLKLNFALGSKNRPNKKHHHKSKQETLDEIESIQNNKEELSENIVETNKTKKSQNSKKRPNYKKKSNNNKKNKNNENLKNNKIKGKNENNEQYANHKSNENNENHYSKKSHQQNGLEKNHKKIKKTENNTKESTNDSYEKTKNSNQKIINPKKRKRPHNHKEEIKDEVRNLDKVEPKLETEVKEESQDIITFRGNENPVGNNNEQYQQKASEIKEVKGKFENIVWSEDKFPKK